MAQMTISQPVPTPAPTVPLMFTQRVPETYRFEMTADEILVGDIFTYRNDKNEQVVMRVEVYCKDFDTMYVYGPVVTFRNGKKVTKGRRATWRKLNVKDVVRHIGSHNRRRY